MLPTSSFFLLKRISHCTLLESIPKEKLSHFSVHEHKAGPFEEMNKKRQGAISAG